VSFGRASRAWTVLRVGKEIVVDDLVGKTVGKRPV